MKTSIPIGRQFCATVLKRRANSICMNGLMKNDERKKNFIPCKSLAHFQNLPVLFGLVIFIFVNYFHFSDFLAARFTVCNDNQSFHTGHWLSTRAHSHANIYYMRSMDLNRNIGIVFWPLIRLNVCVVMRKTKFALFSLSSRDALSHSSHTLLLLLFFFPLVFRF